jgi:hypothetical protein
MHNFQIRASRMMYMCLPSAYARAYHVTILHVHVRAAWCAVCRWERWNVFDSSRSVASGALSAQQQRQSALSSAKPVHMLCFRGACFRVHRLVAARLMSRTSHSFASPTPPATAVMHADAVSATAAAAAAADSASDPDPWWVNGLSPRADWWWDCTDCGCTITSHSRCNCDGRNDDSEQEQEHEHERSDMHTHSSNTHEQHNTHTDARTITAHTSTHGQDHVVDEHASPTSASVTRPKPLSPTPHPARRKQVHKRQVAAVCNGRPAPCRCAYVLICCMIRAHA